MQWMTLQQDTPEEFVIATGNQYSVREFIAWSATELDIERAFEGEGLKERAVVTSVEGDVAFAVEPGQVLVRIDPRNFRPAEVETLLGGPTRAKQKVRQGARDHRAGDLRGDGRRRPQGGSTPRALESVRVEHTSVGRELIAPVASAPPRV